MTKTDYKTLHGYQLSNAAKAQIVDAIKRILLRDLKTETNLTADGFDIDLNVKITRTVCPFAETGSLDGSIDFDIFSPDSDYLQNMRLNYIARDFKGKITRPDGRLFDLNKIQDEMMRIHYPEYYASQKALAASKK